MSKQPPNVNGVMDLTAADNTTIKAKLETIRDAFEPTDETPVCDTFFIVSTYNRENPGNEINGDTAESILN